MRKVDRSFGEKGTLAHAIVCMIQNFSIVLLLNNRKHTQQIVLAQHYTVNLHFSIFKKKHIN